MLAILGEAAIRTLLLAGAVQCVLWLLRVRQARLHLAAWIVVLAASVAMPLLPRFTPLQVPLDSALPAPLLDGASNLLLQPLLPLSPEAGGDPLTQPWVLSWPASIYLAVSGAILLRVALGVALSFRLLCRAVPLRPDWARGTRLRISRDVAAPVTVANVVLLPPDALHWPAETRQAVLAHEGAHVARWDFAMLVVSQLNRAVFWFSPLSWWLHRRLVALAELASDDQAMASSPDRLRYAEILLDMARRSGPASHGPAMARPATLSHRIDRILLNQVPSHPAGRPRQVFLTLAVAALALAAASLISHPLPQPVVEALAPGWNPDAPAPPQAGPGDATRQPAATQPYPGTTLLAEAPPRPTAPSPVPLAAAAVQSPGRVSPQASRQAPRIAPKATPTLSASRTTARPAPLPAARGTDGATAPSAPAPPEPPPSLVRGADAPAPIAPPARDIVQPALAQQAGYASLLPVLPADFQAIMGATCAGTVAVGRGAQSSADRPPHVVPGQLVPARAQFFLKPNGSPWVRFDAFGQPPLDLPVRFTRNGMTWTGEYGVAYTVRAAGGRLTGLAATIRGDSAGLDLTCVRSSLHLL